MYYSYGDVVTGILLHCWGLVLLIAVFFRFLMKWMQTLQALSVSKKAKIIQMLDMNKLTILFKPQN